MKLYAAYGSNMNIEQMKKRCPDAKLNAKGYIFDYEMVFRGRGHANLQKSVGKKVPVVLWVLTEKCEVELDKYEDYPDYYIKDEIDVKVENETYKALIYLMGKDLENVRKDPTVEYVDIIKEGYLSNNIDLKTLNYAIDEIK